MAIDERMRAWIEEHRVDAPEVRADQIIGIEHVTREAASLIARLRHPEVMEAAGGEVPRGILLFGAPGTGKTLTARFMSSQLRQDADEVPFFEFGSDELDADKVPAIFRYLSEEVCQPLAGTTRRRRAVIYLDEIDLWGIDRTDPQHSAESRRTLMAMLKALEGLIEHPGVLLIASSNTHPSNLDAALMRQGRIGFKIVFPSYEEDQRRQVLEYFASTRKTAGRIDWARAARMTRGATPAALKQQLDDALGMALLDGRDAINQDDVEVAIARNGVIEKEIPVGDGFWMRTAIHEAGHVAATAALRGVGRVYRVTLDRSGGVTTTDIDRTIAEHRTNIQLLDGAVIAYAGSRAELAAFGDASAGAHSDHTTANNLIAQLVNLGLDPKTYLLSPDVFRRHSMIGEQVARLAFEAVKARSLASQRIAADIVAANKGAIERFAARLADVRELSGEELQAALRDAGFEDATRRLTAADLELDAVEAAAA